MRTTPLILALAFWLPSALRADDSAGLEFFEKRVRPVLVEHCYECHSAEAKKLKGKLRLDSREAILRGGETGPAVVEGKPEESLLISAVRYRDKELRMPPPKDDVSRKLGDAVIADLIEWVKIGAPMAENVEHRTSNAAALGVRAAENACASDGEERSVGEDGCGSLHPREA